MFPSPVCPHRTTSYSQRCAIVWGCFCQDRLAFLEIGWGEVIIPCGTRPCPDKQQPLAIRDSALPHKVSLDPLSPLGDRSRGGMAHTPPGLGRAWQEGAQGQALL